MLFPPTVIVPSQATLMTVFPNCICKKIHLMSNCANAFISQTHNRVGIAPIGINKVFFVYDLSVCDNVQFLIINCLNCCCYFCAALKHPQIVTCSSSKQDKSVILLFGSWGVRCLYSAVKKYCISSLYGSCGSGSRVGCLPIRRSADWSQAPPAHVSVYPRATSWSLS